MLIAGGPSVQERCVVVACLEPRGVRLTVLLHPAPGSGLQPEMHVVTEPHQFSKKLVLSWQTPHGISCNLAIIIH